VNITFELTGGLSNAASVYVNASIDKTHWETFELTTLVKTDTYKTHFSGTIGPFNESGFYYLKAYAKFHTTILAESYLRLEVEEIVGIIFVGYESKTKMFSDEKQYLEVSIAVLGDNLNEKTVRVTYEEQPEDQEPGKMQLVDGTENVFTDNLGPLPTGIEMVHIRFSANTTDGKQYRSSIYFSFIEEQKAPEGFWLSTFPVIMVSVLVLGMLYLSFFMSKVGPKNDFEKIE
jgi:hypothetical protein